MNIAELSDCERFFYEHAPIAYAPAHETPEEGRVRHAREYARAELALRAGPYYVDHSPDPEPWDADVPWDGPVWAVDLWSVAGRDRPVLLRSVGQVGAELGDPYLRVVAAELAIDAGLAH